MTAGAIVLPAILLWTALAAPGAVWAQTAQEVRDTVDETLTERQQTQGRLDDWAGEKAALTARYQAAKADVAWLSERKRSEEAEVASLEARVAEMRRRLEEADRLESSMADTLTVILRSLEASVQGSLPFLPAERRLRLDSLREELARPDVPAAEKLRRLLEALQVEAGYGSTVEVYQDRIEVAGEGLHADILRLGRLSLFWRTPDGDRIGHYDRAAGAWTELPGKHRRAVVRAMEMASRLRPIEIIDLPLGKVAP